MLMAGLRRQFDTILIEAPPLLPVVDGRVLADYADHIAFVMTWRKTPKQLAKRALAALGHNQPKVAGVVINSVDQDALADSHGLGTAFGLPAPAATQRAA